MTSRLERLGALKQEGAVPHDYKAWHHRSGVAGALARAIPAFPNPNLCLQIPDWCAGPSGEAKSMIQ